MKRLILTALATAGVTMLGYSQGTITFDTTEGVTPPAFNVTIDGTPDNGTDINVALMYSISGTAGTYAPVVTLLLDNSSTTVTSSLGTTQPAAGDITSFGILYDNSGNAYTIPTGTAGSPAWFEVEGWTGTGVDSYASATTLGTTAPFQVILTAVGAPVLANIDNMPTLALVTVPEPATFALAGLGIASLLAIRRRK